MSIDKPTPEQLKEWNKKLASEGLSTWSGREDKKQIYVENTDVFQTKPQSGRLARYKLGERVSHRKSCVVCGDSFSSKRDDAQTCGHNCRIALMVIKRIGSDRLKLLVEQINP